MEDKTFELLTKMYNDFSKQFGDVENEIRHVGNQVTRIEDDHGRKLDALFDGYRQTSEKLQVIEEKIDTLSEKVDKHDIKSQVIEGARR